MERTGLAGAGSRVQARVQAAREICAGPGAER